MPPPPSRHSIHRPLALVPLLLAACQPGGATVADAPTTPDPKQPEVRSVAVLEPATDVTLAANATLHVAVAVQDPFGTAGLRLLLDADGDATTRGDQRELRTVPAGDVAARVELDVAVPAGTPDGDHTLLAVLDDGEHPAVTARAPGRVRVRTSPVDPPGGGDPLTLQLAEPATDVRIARGGLLPVRFAVGGATGTVSLRLVADADGDAATTGDQHELDVRPVTAGAPPTDALLPVTAPVGTYRVFGTATGATGTVATAAAPGTLTVASVAFAVREGNTSYEEGRAVAAWPDGSLLVAGRFSGTTTFGVWPNVTHLNSAGDDDVFLARYGPDGALAWARRAGGPSRADWPHAVATAADGSFVVGGSFHGLAAFDGGAATTGLQSAGDDDGFVARYAGNGTMLWAKRLGGVLRDEVTGVARAADGALLLTGSFAAQATFGGGATPPTLLVRGSLLSTDGFVARYDANGTPLWVRPFGASDVDDAGRAIAATPDGGAIVAGVFRGVATFGAGADEVTLIAAGGSDAFVARYDATGTLLWARRGGGTSNDEVRGVAVMADGGCVVVGGYRGQATFSDATQPVALLAIGGLDAFVARYAADGTLRSVRTIGGTAEDETRGAVATADGGCVVTGHFTTTAAATGTAAPANLVAAGARDVFVARYDANGGLAWLRAAGGTEHDQVLGIGAAVDGSFTITGSFLGIAGFGTGAARRLLTAAGWADAFVVRYDADGDL